MYLAGLLCALPAKSWVSPGLEYFCEMRDVSEAKSHSRILKNPYTNHKYVHPRMPV